MANVLSSQITQIINDGMNEAFDSAYKARELELFKEWVMEAYPQVAKEYGYVKDIERDL